MIQRFWCGGCGNLIANESGIDIPKKVIDFEDGEILGDKFYVRSQCSKWDKETEFQTSYELATLASKVSVTWIIKILI